MVFTSCGFVKMKLNDPWKCSGQCLVLGACNNCCPSVPRVLLAGVAACPRGGDDTGWEDAQGEGMAVGNTVFLRLL